MRNHRINKKNMTKSNRSTFNFYVSMLVATAALVFFVVASSISPTLISGFNPLIIFVVTIIALLGALKMASSFGNIPLQMSGFYLLPFILGIVSSPWLHKMDSGVLYQAGVMTLLALGFMMIVSSLFPAFFERIIGALTIALIGLILLSVLAMFVSGINLTLFHILSMIIFMGFLGYDLVKAREVPPTLSHAILISATLFIDLMNIFMDIANSSGSLGDSFDD